MKNSGVSNAGESQPAEGLTLAQLSRRLRSGALSSADLLQVYLRRINECEHRIGAWAWIDAARAMRSARKADAESRHSKKPHGKLHGIPVGIKDIILTRGIPTEMGCAARSGYVPDVSAEVVMRIEQAGGFVLGKTVTTELATQNPGKTRNPWNPLHTPGGSSSGSAAAVAAGFVPIAVGTQTRGSVIRPAAYCGVVGFKPSYGLIPTAGVNPLSPSLDHVGVFANSVDDAAFFAAILSAGCTPDEDGAQREVFPSNADDLRLPRHRLRLAVVRAPAWDRAEPAQRKLLQSAARRFTKAGASVENLDLASLLAQAVQATRTIQLGEVAAGYAAIVARDRSGFSRRFRQYVSDGLKISAADYLGALQTRRRIQQSFAAIFRRYDALLTLPALGEAPKGLTFTGDAVYCAAWTLCGFPAVSIPAGLGPLGLPLGLQIVGGHLDDWKTLLAAKWCARQIDFGAVCPIQADATTPKTARPRPRKT